MSNIKCIKLVTGEDVICDYSIENGVSILENPVQVSMVPSRSNGQPNFGFIPFPLVSNDKKITLDTMHILYICDPAEEFVEQYNTLFGNIISPPKSLIL